MKAHKLSLLFNFINVTALLGPIETFSFYSESPRISHYYLKLNPKAVHLFIISYFLHETMSKVIFHARIVNRVKIILSSNGVKAIKRTGVKTMEHEI